MSAWNLVEETAEEMDEVEFQLNDARLTQAIMIIQHHPVPPLLEAEVLDLIDRLETLQEVFENRVPTVRFHQRTVVLVAGSDVRALARAVGVLGPGLNVHYRIGRSVRANGLNSIQRNAVRYGVPLPPVLNLFHWCRGIIQDNVDLVLAQHFDAP